MKVLVVIGANLQFNCSANLCHIAIIRGLCDLGCDVTVLSRASNEETVDESIVLPKTAKYFTYPSSRLFKYVNKETRQNISHNVELNKVSFKQKIYLMVKNQIKALYGPFGFNKVWIKNVSRGFKPNDSYDLVLSLSSPVESHVAAYQMIENKHVKTKHFCELWEDPWQYDVYRGNPNKKLLNLEYDITHHAETILYVSPLTLKYQKAIFPQTSDRMDWVPLPAYYKSDEVHLPEGTYRYGYFGAYNPSGRNLEPFYQAAKELKLSTVICGEPENLFQETDTIKIYARMTLEALKKYENNTNVLIFLCNLRGGQIPGKLYQYAATNKKILFILDGSKEEKKILREYFSKFNRFYFCENNKDDICQTVSFLENDKSTSNEPLDYFNPSHIAEEILKKCHCIWE